MSRELLKRAVRFMSVVGCSNDDICELCDEIEAYLAQSEPEPLASESREVLEHALVTLKHAAFFPGDEVYAKVVMPHMEEYFSNKLEYLTEKLLRDEVVRLEQQLAAMQVKREPLSDAKIESCRLKALEDDYYEDVDWGVTARKRLNVIEFARAIEKAHGIGVK